MPEIIEDVEWLKIPKNSVNSRKINKFSGCSYLTNRRKNELNGPRPELVKYTGAYEGEEKDILCVRPGITDFSSVEFINLDEIVGGENADEMYEKYVLKKKNKLRIKYAHEVSLGTDVYILFKTLKAVFDKAFGFLVKKEHR